MLKKSYVKKIVSLILLLAFVVAVSTPLIGNASIGAGTVLFSLDIEPHGEFTHTPNYRYRNTTDASNAWAVRLDYSDEPTVSAPDGSGNTATRFWLGIYNPDGTNPVGSKKHDVTEGGKYFDYFAAYAKASKKNVYLYASDNIERSIGYTVKGYWNPATGKLPDNA